jgi:hypothetical protein
MKVIFDTNILISAIFNASPRHCPNRYCVWVFGNCYELKQLSIKIVDYKLLSLINGSQRSW